MRILNILTLGLIAIYSGKTKAFRIPNVPPSTTPSIGSAEVNKPLVEVKIDPPKDKTPHVDENNDTRLKLEKVNDAKGSSCRFERAVLGASDGGVFSGAPLSLKELEETFGISQLPNNPQAATYENSIENVEKEDYNILKMI